MASHVHSHSNPLDGARPRSTRWVRFIDTLGIWLSAICVVHCALTPILIVALPVVASHDFDLLARSVLAGIGVFGVGLGTWIHKNLRALPMLLAALVLFAGLGLFELVTGHHPDAGWELGIGLLASFALMGAHALNTKACRDSDHECAPGRWFADNLWSSHRLRFDRAFFVALAFAGGLHAALIGFAVQ